MTGQLHRRSIPACTLSVARPCAHLAPPVTWPLLNATPETSPALAKTLHGRIMAAIAIGQVPRTGTAAQQQELLLNGFETKSMAAAWAAIGKPGRTPAAAQQQGRARLDLAHLGQDGRGLIHRPAPP